MDQNEAQRLIELVEKTMSELSDRVKAIERRVQGVLDLNLEALQPRVDEIESTVMEVSGDLEQLTDGIGIASEQTAVLSVVIDVKAGMERMYMVLRSLMDEELVESIPESLFDEEEWDGYITDDIPPDLHDVVLLHGHEYEVTLFTDKMRAEDSSVILVGIGKSKRPEMITVAELYKLEIVRRADEDDIDDDEEDDESEE